MSVTKPLNATAKVRDRQARILQIAESIFSQEGEQGLQMKDLASKAGTSLATLYGHFPSKDHVLGAIAFARQHRVASRFDPTTLVGATAGERAGEIMRAEFRTVQRHPEMAVALQRVSNAPDRSTSEYVAGVRSALMQMVLAAIASTGTPATPEQHQILPIFLSTCSGAMNGWLSGILSVDEAHAQIVMAERLIDLPGDVARRYVLSPPPAGHSTEPTRTLRER